MANRTRAKRISIYLNDEERQLLTEKMNKAGYSDYNSFYRKLLDKVEINVADTSEIKNDVRLILKHLTSAANNINQVAKRANELRSAYEVEFNTLESLMKETRDEVKNLHLAFQKRITILGKGERV